MTSENICECGHEKDTHYNRKGRCSICGNNLKNACRRFKGKKFQPRKEKIK